ncbi:MAG: SRPBCC domain-containing protein [Myxococcota bacterium]
MSESIEVTRVLPASPERIFRAWLDPKEHGAMSGGKATADGQGGFTASDGYITGRTLESEPYRRIVQAWRTTEFPDGSPDSRLEVLLEPAQGGTRLTLRHDNLPDGQGHRYREGWSEYYFDPMERYFGSPRERWAAAGETLSDAAEQVSEAFSAAGEQASEAFDAVSAQAKKAASTVRGLVKKASKQLKAAQKRAAQAASRAAKKVRPKKKAAKQARPKKKAGAKKKPAQKSRR